MARKDLLKGLMETPAKNPRDKGQAPAPADPARPRYTKGAIGAVSRSIAELKSRSISDLDPFSIKAGGVQDRLDSDDADHKALMASIKEYGQQVPVLVRPHPEHEGKYQIVYGRRRVLALCDLGLPVKALIRDLDDQELVVAQGQENTVRKDLSFIEKANFARQMRDAKYSRKIICDALNIDKTVISRMLAIVDRLPVDVIIHIGPAPSVGRDRWLALADDYERLHYDAASAISMIALTSEPADSDARFEALQKALNVGKNKAATRPVQPLVEKQVIRNAKGQEIAMAQRSKSKIQLTFKTKSSDGFEDWLMANLEEIHRTWKQDNGE